MQMRYAMALLDAGPLLVLEGRRLRPGILKL